MNVTKTDIMTFFKEREKELKQRIEETRYSNMYEFNKARLYECQYIGQLISITWNIIHQKKGK